jgi:hypothetical protein
VTAHLLAHAISGRADLPLPLPLFLYGAGFALVASFVALRALWPDPKLADAAEGRVAPGVVQAAAAAAAIVLRVVGVLAYALVLVAAIAGEDDTSRNIAPVAFYILFWVGLQLLSAVAGNVWRFLSPFETAADALGLEDTEVHSQWPAAGVLLAFAWLELAYQAPSRPRIVAIALVLHLLVLVVGMAVRGRGWLRSADGFGVLFSFLALLAPVFRDDDGRIRFRVPGSGLSTLVIRPGTVAVIQVALGATAFDGLSRSSFWRDLTAGATGWTRTGYATVGLVVALAAVVGVWELACSQIPRFTSGPRREGAPDDERVPAERFAHSLIPIALAYSIAHYFSSLAFEGQTAIALVSDPFGRSWDLFGTAAHTVDYTLVSTATIAFVQAGAVVLGHVAGVVAAHDRAVETLPAKAAARSQHPLLVAMVAYTVAALALLLGA